MKPQEQLGSQETGRGLNRRDFIKASVVAGMAWSAVPALGAAKGTQEIPQRPLGKTGLKVSILGLGGYHIGSVPEQTEAIRLMRHAIDQGITFMDNCWDYHSGKSEEWMGKALQDGYRKKAGLMTKIDGQTKKSAANQIDESLQRLQTDHVDLMQFHEVIRTGDPDRIFGPEGAIEAMLAARKAGKIRFIGFTGHKDPKMHLRMIEVGRKNGIRFDAVQMPLNLMDTHYRSFEQDVLPVLIKDGIAVLAMKPMGAGHLLRSGAVTARQCLEYALSLPVATVITGIDSAQVLQQALDVGRGFQSPAAPVLDSLRSRTAPHAREGKFEPFKNTTQFDGTVQNPHWLG
jgi:uncharacterized protein